MAQRRAPRVGMERRRHGEHGLVLRRVPHPGTRRHARRLARLARSPTARSAASPCRSPISPPCTCRRCSSIRSAWRSGCPTSPTPTTCPIRSHGSRASPVSPAAPCRAAASCRRSHRKARSPSPAGCTRRTVPTTRRSATRSTALADSMPAVCTARLRRRRRADLRPPRRRHRPRPARPVGLATGARQATASRAAGTARHVRRPVEARPGDPRQHRRVRRGGRSPAGRVGAAPPTGRRRAGGHPPAPPDRAGGSARALDRAARTRRRP